MKSVHAEPGEPEVGAPANEFENELLERAQQGWLSGEQFSIIRQSEFTKKAAGPPNLGPRSAYHFTVAVAGGELCDDGTP
jgi:hypothetical protein